WLASLLHKAASYAVGVSMALRTSAMAHSPAKNLRAVSFSICWLSDNPNCMIVLLNNVEPQRAQGNAERNHKSASMLFGISFSDHVRSRRLIPLLPLSSVFQRVLFLPKAKS